MNKEKFHFKFLSKFQQPNFFPPLVCALCNSHHMFRRLKQCALVQRAIANKKVQLAAWCHWQRFDGGRRASVCLWWLIRHREPNEAPSFAITTTPGRPHARSRKPTRGSQQGGLVSRRWWRPIHLHPFNRLRAFKWRDEGSVRQRHATSMERVPISKRRSAAWMYYLCWWRSCRSLRQLWMRDWLHMDGGSVEMKHNVTSFGRLNYL